MGTRSFVSNNTSISGSLMIADMEKKECGTIQYSTYRLLEHAHREDRISIESIARLGR